MRSAVVKVLVGTALLAVALAAPGTGTAAAPPARLQQVGTFDQPVAVAAPRGDRRLFVVERRGRIRLVREGRTLSAPFADLTRQVVRPRGPETVDQRGLFSIAFAPDYARSGLLYAFFVDRRSHLRVDELRRDDDRPDRVDPGARRTVIDLGRVSVQHHGGQVQFDPGGLLWISTGDDAEPGSARDLGSWHGKLLRIDPRRTAAGGAYAIPAGNPFAERTGARPEVVASGLRNPWRFAFDPPSGLLIVGDVGASLAEEVDALPIAQALGADFGWDVVEGRTRHRRTRVPGYAAPSIVHRHGDGWCAVVGGVVVRDPRLPRLAGRYLYGDVCSGRLWSARLDREGRARDDRRLRLDAPYLVSFGSDGRGRVHAISLGGAVWRLDPA